MANLSTLTRSLSLIANSLSRVRLGMIVSSRSYAIFPRHYIKPIYDKANQAAQVESGEAIKIAHTPILPALTDNTSSEFHDPEIAKFINFIMRKGKKQLARQLLDETFTNVKRIQLKRYHSATPEQRENIELDPVKIFYRAVENTTPVMDTIRSSRGGVTYQVPVPILDNRQRFLAMNWLIKAAKEKPRNERMHVALAQELVDAAHNQGRAVKKKQDLHKLCDANRAYAHFRWM